MDWGPAELGDLPFEVRLFYDFDLEDTLDLVAAEPRPYQGSALTKALLPGPAGGYYGYVAVQDITDRIIGWLSAEPDSSANPDLTKLRINVVVAPDQRRKGVGRALFDHFINDAAGLGVQELTARVSAGEADAIEFLQANEFARDGAPGDGEDLRFVRRLA